MSFCEVIKYFKNIFTLGGGRRGRPKKPEVEEETNDKEKEEGKMDVDASSKLVGRWIYGKISPEIFFLFSPTLSLPLPLSSSRLRPRAPEKMMATKDFERGFDAETSREFRRKRKVGGKKTTLPLPPFLLKNISGGDLVFCYFFYSFSSFLFQASIS